MGMKFKVGNIVVRKGHPSYQRARVEKVYQDTKGVDRMTTKDIRFGGAGANRRQDAFVVYPYYPSDAVIERTKKALAPEKAFKLGGKTYLALPSRLIPELVIQHITADGLIARDPDSLGWNLWHVTGKPYSEYRKETEADGRQLLPPTTYIYEVLRPLEQYESRWW